MSENLTTSDWLAARGQKWSAQLSGMEAMFRHLDEPLVRALALEAPSRIAEVGCGGGGTSIGILRRAPAGSVVHGFDISPTLIGRAQERVLPGDHGLVFQVADMATAQPEEPYHRLVSRFGVMFFTDEQGAFANLRRWLRPGGRFVFAVWGPAPENPWLRRVRDVVAQFVEVPATDPQAPGPFRYADADKFLGVLRHAGFEALEVSDWRGTLPIGGGLPPAEAAHFALTSFSTFSELLTQAGADAFEEARRSLTACFSSHVRDGAVHMDACIHIVTGRVSQQP